jgi:hypothetical protein
VVIAGVRLITIPPAGGGSFRFKVHRTLPEKVGSLARSRMNGASSANRPPDCPRGNKVPLDYKGNDHRQCGAQNSPSGRTPAPLDPLCVS